MDDSDYALFARIIEAGSLSAAARKLLISPAMVSKRLMRLEQRLGVRLIHRTTRKLSLTAAGTQFYEDVTQILQSIEQAEARISGVRDEPIGILRVSAPTSFGRLHIAPHLHDFLERYPGVELEFDLTDRIVDLFAGQIDLAVRITSNVPENLDAYRLGANRRVLCASQAYLDRHGEPKDMKDLQANHRLLAADGQLPWRLQADAGIRTVEGRSHVRTNSSEIVRELALCGEGIAYRSMWDIHAELISGRLVPVLSQWGAPTDLCIYALHPKSPTVTAATKAFVSFLGQIVDPLEWNVKIDKKYRN